MWSHVVIEGFCFADTQDGVYPCGRNYPSTLCLGNTQGRCPHFAWADSDEREAASFVSLRLIIWDRLLLFKEDAYRKLQWWFWDKRFFDFEKEMAKYKSEPCPEWDEKQEKATAEFQEWIKGVSHE